MEITGNPNSEWEVKLDFQANVFVDFGFAVVVFSVSHAPWNNRREEEGELKHGITSEDHAR